VGFLAMTKPDYAWPRYTTGPEKHLHALGGVALNFGLYEDTLVLLFRPYLPDDLAFHLCQHLSNTDKTAALRARLRRGFPG
jgi:hypothetical protein